MAKFDLKFLCESGTEDAFIKCNLYEDDFYKKTIRIILKDPLVCENSLSTIYLDKSTAIKFAKTLRTEINKITESEVKNV